MVEIIAEDDGLPCSEVGAWAEDKYKLVGLYDRLFSTGMKNKWPTRVYVDLYSGPGFVRVRDTGRMLVAAPRGIASKGTCVLKDRKYHG